MSLLEGQLGGWRRCRDGCVSRDRHDRNHCRGKSLGLGYAAVLGFLAVAAGGGADEVGTLAGSAGAAALQRVVGEVEADIYKPHVDRVFGLDEIVAAHRYMEGNEAAGKLVMVP
jgi:hypothetical protein